MSRVRLPIIDDARLSEKQSARMQKVVDRPVGSLVVHEIYASIQGESTYAGLPCTFVRLTGCPLRCRWCDTPHSFTEGAPMMIEAIVQRVESLGPRLVEVTGGEPLAQVECDALLTALADTGRTVLLETSGAISIASVDPRVIVILDMKCPSSGEEPSNDYANLDRLGAKGEIKFVIGNREDFDWSVRLIRERNLDRYAILFSAVYEELPYPTLCDWTLESGLAARIQVPLHKTIWGPDVRGV